MGSGDRTALVRICDPAGRPRGTGFVADDRGTVVTGHEVVDGQSRLVLHGADGRTRGVGAGDVTALPERGLALLRTGGLPALGAEPVPIAGRGRIAPGAYVTIAAHGRREARILGVCPVTYAAHGRLHRIEGALELALGTSGADALRLGGAAAGGRSSTRTAGRSSPCWAPLCGRGTPPRPSRCRSAGRAPTARSASCCGATPRPCPGTAAI